MLFKWISIHAGLRSTLKTINQWLWAFRVPWSSGFVLDLRPRCDFWKSSKRPWNMIHLMPCRNPCRLYIHLPFTYSVGPSSVMWSELGPALPFPPMRVLKVYESRALSLVCEVALSTTLYMTFRVICYWGQWIVACERASHSSNI